MNRAIMMVLAGSGAAILLAGAAVTSSLGQEGTSAMNPEPTGQTELATFGAGCFWCVEAVFQRVPGVISVVPGYAGGRTQNPTYKEVCGGQTGHVEVAQIEFDPTVVSYEKLLDVFWKCHDPTTLNRQGADVGTQYRSAIFYHGQNQREVAERSKQSTQESGLYKQAIVTEIAPLTAFYRAENYHQDYYDNNPNAPYCQYVIRPKLEKLGLE